MRALHATASGSPAILRRILAQLISDTGGMNKLTLLTGAAIGYVLGARAGRDRYEQIKASAGRAWRSDAVQQQVGKATDQVKQKGPEVAAAAGQAAVRGAADAAKSALAAGFSAATSGKHQGPVLQGDLADETPLVRGTIADGSSYDAPGEDAPHEAIVASDGTR